MGWHVIERVASSYRMGPPPIGRVGRQRGASAPRSLPLILLLKIAVGTQR